MLLNNSLAIYAYYDPFNKLTDEALYYLIELKSNFERVLLVVNGGLNDFSGDVKSKLFEKGIEIYERDNEGYDFGAWKEAILSLGPSQIKSLDYLCLCNSSCFGPVVPFKKTLEKIEKSTADLIGLTEHRKAECFDRHIQTFFIVFKKGLLNSSFFYNYWLDLRVPHDWKDIVLDCELKLTNEFESNGFKTEVIFKNEFLTTKEPNTTILYAYELLKNDFPLLKKKILTTSYDYFLSKGNANEAKKALEYVAGVNPQLASYIQEFIATRVLPSLQRSSLHNTIIVSSKDSLLTHVPENKRVGCVFFVFYPDLIDECLKYIQNIPPDVRVCITSSKEKLLELYRQKLLDKPNIEFRLKDSRGRNEAAFFVTCSDLLRKWDYCCLLHDKKTAHAPHAHMGESWFEHCLLSLIPSKEFIYNVIEQFEKKKNLGMVTPPPPLFAVWTPLILLDPWASNQEIAKKILKNFSSETTLDDDPMAPYGGMAWFRTTALKGLLDLNLSTRDFPPEPLPINGTILHGLERIYPQIVQSHGQTNSWILSTEYAPVYIDNLYFQLKRSVWKEFCLERQGLSLARVISYKLRNHQHIHSTAKILYLLAQKLRSKLTKENLKKTIGLNKVKKISEVTQYFIAHPLSKAGKDFILILPGLNQASFSGGPNTALLFAAEFARKGFNICCVALGEACEDLILQKHVASLLPEEDKWLSSYFTSHTSREVLRPRKDSVVCATAAPTCSLALKIREKYKLQKLPLYLIQDFEPGFYQWGDSYADAYNTYFSNFRPIINEKLLRDYFIASPFLSGSIVSEQALYFEPAIDRNVFYPELNKENNKIFIFYARPNAPRNLYRYGLEALKIAVSKGIFPPNKWKILFIGDPSINGPVDLGHGVKAEIAPWMNFLEYGQLIRSCSAGLSLMLSPHSSYLPLELAACAKPVVTNYFANKNEKSLRSISPLIIGTTPNPSSISEGIIKCVKLAEVKIEDIGLNKFSSKWRDSFKNVIDALEDLNYFK